jgi:lipopolysaccharide/colanic/teichoic acid biosynthesis glycosyltransferase
VATIVQQAALSHEVDEVQAPAMTWAAPHRAYKRPFDIVMASCLIVASSPLMAVIGLVVKLTSPGPVFFRQERVGLNGRRFVVTKFRSMYANVDSTPHHEYFKQYLKGASAPDEKQNVYKLRKDPRITPVGRVIRRLGLDELPQLFEVVKGDMSLIGPRPPLDYEVAHYSPRHMQRLSVKPGITGLWQVRGRDIVNFERMVDMDLEYVRDMSLWLDLKIVALTVPSLLWAFVTK